jgi:hypothetical protein
MEGVMLADNKKWRGRVYKTHVESGLGKVEWRILRDQVLIRDNQICLRCDKKFRAKGKLSVHHVIPRSEDGSNDFTNLVTLCNPCHDHVEINRYRTVAEIIGSYEDPAVVIEPQDQTETLEDDDLYNRPEWHKWVYGGVRRNVEKPVYSPPFGAETP